MKTQYVKLIVIGAALILLGLIAVPYWWYYILPDVCHTFKMSDGSMHTDCSDVFDFTAAVFGVLLTIGGIAALIRGIAGDEP